MDRFGELRSLLHREPTFETFHAICNELETHWEGEDLTARAVPYVSRFLEDWPDHVRGVTERECRRLVAGEPPRLPMALFRILDLSDVHLDIPGFQRLMSTLDPGNVCILDLSTTGIGFTAMEALAQSPLLKQLTQLKLRECYIRDTGVDHLCRANAMDRMEELDLEVCQITDDGLKLLAESSYLGELRVLRLADNSGVSDRGIDELVRSPLLEQLEVLDLHRTHVGTAGMVALAATPRARNLTMLRANVHQVGISGAQALVESEHTSDSVRDFWTRELDRVDALDVYDLR